MALSVRVLMVLFALVVFSAGFGQNAYAFGKHAPKPAKVHHAKKNRSIYDYLGPKKLKKAKGGWYQSPVSGQMVYGVKKR